MGFHVIIPARYGSTRLPGKPLLDIAGKPMIQHVYERAKESGAENVVIATDDKRIADVASGFGAEVCMTADHHRSGTERIAEVVEALELESDDIVVNLQGDLPLVPPEMIHQVANDLADTENVKVSTLCEVLSRPADLFDPNVVKVVMNRRNFAMYFSRAPIPWDMDQFKGVDLNHESLTFEAPFYVHIGIYAYRAGFLNTYLDWDSCYLGGIEKLEQLRVLWNCGRIHMAVTNKSASISVDTEEDLNRARELIAA